MTEQADPNAFPSIIVDAHQDIAWQTVVFGRNYLESAYAKRRREAASEHGQAVIRATGNATIGLPEMLLGRVGITFGTLYVSPAALKFADPFDAAAAYETPAQAHQKAMNQLDRYQQLADDHDQIRLVRTQRELAAVLATWQPGVDFEQHKLGIVMLMEGADPIREPKAFEEWYERGVRIVGPAWSETRYSGGTGKPGPLTSQGRELLEVMASFGAILDVSHAAEDACNQMLDRYEGPIIASHSNPRRFCDSDRHLSDDMIRRLVERGGVIGTVLFNRFLYTGRDKSAPKSTAPLVRVIDILDHVCQVAGSPYHAGIGSDFDGGFGYENIPAELDTVADLAQIGTGLAARGYQPQDVQAILGGNFLRVLKNALPR